MAKYSGFGWFVGVCLWLMFGGDGTGDIPAVGLLMRSLLSFPHSNADVKRIFSHDIRLKPSTETI